MHRYGVTIIYLLVLNSSFYLYAMVMLTIRSVGGVRGVLKVQGDDRSQIKKLAQVT